jgi:hypothetical protein
MNRPLARTPDLPGWQPAATRRVLMQPRASPHTLQQDGEGPMPKTPEDVTRELLQFAREARLENVALQSVCAALLAEIAILHASPGDKLGAMVASLQGMAHGVAREVDEQGLTPTITKVIENVCSMAEAILVSRKRGE